MRGIRHTTGTAKNINFDDIDDRVKFTFIPISNRK